MPEAAFYFKKLRMGFERGETRELREIGNTFIQLLSRTGEKQYSELAAISYSLHKMLSKVHFIEEPGWQKTRKEIIALMQSAQTNLKKNDLKGFDSALAEMVLRISQADSEMGNYSTGIIDKARVKNASSLYGMGLSLARAAELAGADKKDLSNYIGGTKMHDEGTPAFSISTRLEQLKRLVAKK